VIVIDANVAVKWYIPERGTEAALELMSGPSQLLGPELIRLEVLAAISRRVRNGESTTKEARSRCDNWFNHLREGAVSLIPEADVLQDALALSFTVRHALQDCLYLATAQRLDAPLVTADRRFCERAKSVYKAISLLPGCEDN
jgi:predicted nucleic acid-binding protein